MIRRPFALAALLALPLSALAFEAPDPLYKLYDHPAASDCGDTAEPAKANSQLYPPTQRRELVSSFDMVFNRDRLQAFYPNYLAVARANNETKAQFQVSIRYRLLDTAAFISGGLGPLRAPHLDVAYTGLYDFFVFGDYRPSQPVVSRDQNPGLFFCFPWDDSPNWMPLELGAFHESNGQTIGVRGDAAQSRRDLADQAAKLKYADDAQDYVSRSWNYLNLTQTLVLPLDGDLPEPYGVTRPVHTHQRLLITPSVRYYTLIDCEEDQWWEDHPRDAHRSESDSLRLELMWDMVLPNPWLNYLALSAEVRTGYQYDAFRHFSFRYTATARLLDVPLFAFFNHGCGPYISDYANQHWDAGLGVRLW